jgi:predicted RNA polymerase sigma factor
MTAAGDRQRGALTAASGEVSLTLDSQVFRENSGRSVATLIRVFGDIDLAEDAVHEAFIAVHRRQVSAETSIHWFVSCPLFDTERSALTDAGRSRCERRGNQSNDAHQQTMRHLPLLLGDRLRPVRCQSRALRPALSGLWRQFVCCHRFMRAAG